MTDDDSSEADAAFRGFRVPPEGLTGEREARIRARLQELTQRQPDIYDRRPFDSQPLPVATRPGRERHRRVHDGYQAAAGWLVVASVALALVLGAGMVVRHVSDPNTVGGASLTAMADRARQAEALPFEGRVLHIQTDEGERSDGSLRTQKVETWMDENGTGRLTRSEQAVLEPDGHLAMVEDVEETLTAGQMGHAPAPFSDLRSVPTAPEELLEALDRAGATSPELKVIALAKLLSLPVISSDVRAAAILALGQLGAEPGGQELDRLERQGDALLIDQGDRVSMLIIDPDTSRLLERRAVPYDRDPAVPEQATSWFTVVNAQLAAPASP